MVARRHNLMRWKVCALAALAGAWFGLPVLAVAPSPGSEIRNQASATYSDSGEVKAASVSSAKSLLSNIALVIVSGLETGTLTPGRTAVREPGAIVFFSHRLLNTGNLRTPYTLHLQNLSGTDFDLRTLKITLDANHNGVEDGGEATLPEGAVVTLEPGEFSDLIITGLVPGTALENQQGKLEFTASSQDLTLKLASTDSVLVKRLGGGAAMQLDKTASTASASRNAEVAFALVSHNIGVGTAGGIPITVDGAVQTKLVLRDVIPAQTTLSGPLGLGSFQPLYHLAGNPLHAYTANLPADLTRVDAVAFAFSPVGVGEAIRADFKVKVQSTASGAITNIGTVYFGDGTLLANTDSAPVLLKVWVLPAFDLQKSASTLTPNRNEVVLFTLTGRNTGEAAALGIPIVIDGRGDNRVILRDAIPVNTSFTEFAGTGLGTPLYHRLGDPLHTYMTSPPADLTTVDAVAFAYPNLNPSVSLTAAFRVQIHANAAGNLPNTASLFYADDQGATVKDSNLVELQVTAGGTGSLKATVAYYTTADFTEVAARTRLGVPLHIQVDAAEANQDPTVAEHLKVTITSTITGDVETVDAIETGPNTGLFRISNLQTLHLLGTNPTHENGVMETVPNDELIARSGGSVGASAVANVVVDPVGVVFDSRTGSPIPGAIVNLIDVTGMGNGGEPGGLATVYRTDGRTRAPNPVTTGPDGRFEFPVVSTSRYKIVVVPPANYTFPSTVAPAALPAGHPINATGSYGQAFEVDSSIGSMTSFDLPLDYHSASSLFVEKTAGRTLVELGDTVEYTVRVKNSSGRAMTGVRLMDMLPAGFRLQAGTVCLNGARLPDTSVTVGAALTFAIGTLGDGETASVTYRVRVGPGAMQGNGINRAQATAQGPAPATSNTASCRVQIQEGVFTDKAIIIGKVFVDANHNGIQDLEELGIPGVRLFLEDGSFVITDSEGKYSFYGIQPKMHVLKVDSITLPRGARLVPISTRNAGDGNSRFVDLKVGEMHKANFAEGSASPELLAEVKARRAKGDPLAAELEKKAKDSLTPDGVLPLVSDPKGLPASGIIGGGLAGESGTNSLSSVPSPATAKPGPQKSSSPAASPAASNTASATNQAHFTPVLPDGTLNSDNSDLPASPVRLLPRTNLEQAITNLTNNALGFIDLKDLDTLPFSQANVRIKGVMGANLSFKVNGQEVLLKQMGKAVVMPEKQLEVREYIGVSLLPGTNLLELAQMDNFGNPRGQVSLRVIAPDKLAKLKIVLPPGDSPADGVTPVKIGVLLQDEKGVPVSSRTPLTLEASLGRWEVEDLDKKEPGVQVFLEGGRGEYRLVPPSEPGTSHLVVSSGMIKTETDLPFMPELRPMIAVGLIQGTINLSRLNAGALVPPRSQDGFEEELSSFALSGDGRDTMGGRTAFYLKGKIRGDYLLTAGFDSSKQTRERLFRDIQPDEFYPVYGDSSIKGFDAQSTGRLYVRVDKKRSYLLYGDFTTQSSSEARGLGNYNRSLTGVREHYEKKNIAANLWASQDSTRQVIEELAANGTSGPYYFHNANGILNSEQVEILTRDRHQPSLILKSVPMTRFTDYEFEPFTGQILFKAPVPSLDSNLNPISIRITYEVQQGGEKFWVYGGDAQIKLHERVEVGGAAVNDENPMAPYKLYSANTTLKLASRTFLMGEVAESDSMGVTGQAGRAEIRHQGDKTDARIYFGKTGNTFTNTGSVMTSGRTEGGMKVTQKLDDKTRLIGQGIWTEDGGALGGTRRGVRADVERSFGKDFKAELGVRHSEETQQPASSSTVGATPFTVNSVRLRLTAKVPKVPDASVYAEYENDVVKPDNRMVALGGDYEVANRTRFYARHEFISALGGPFELNSVQQHNSTVAGLETDYMKDGRLFNEYRVRDAMPGREAEASTGLRNLWNVAEGLRLNTTLERVTPFSGNSQNESTAGTVAMDYTRDPLWKGNARLELRTSDANDSLLNSLGYARKVSRDWTFLAKTILYLVNNHDPKTKDLVQGRFQTGMAYRQTDTDRWNGLMKYEYRYEDGNPLIGAALRRHVHVLSLQVNYQPAKDWILSARYAGKLALEDSLTGSDTYHAHLVGGRVIYELSRRWDVGFNESVFFSEQFNNLQYAVGPEVGFTIKSNLRIALGYNLLGFHDPDLSSENYANPGFFVNLSLKFDETLFGAGKNE